MNFISSKKEGNNTGKLSNLLDFLLENKAFVILFCLSVIIALSLQNSFLNSANLINIIRQVCVTCVMSAGTTLVFTSGKMDLSIGALLSMLGVIMAQMYIAGYSLLTVLLVGIVIGGVCGYLNGFISTIFGLNPFIVTLATQQVFKGISFLLSNNTPVSGLDDKFKFIGQGYIIPKVLPTPVLIMFVVLIIVSVVLYRTKFGRLVVAIGGNEEAARVSGINTGQVRRMVYMFTGMTCAVAALIMTARVSSAQPTAGIGMEMDAICAIVLGGTVMGGGKGKVFGTLIGCLIVGVVANALNLHHVNPNWQFIAKGIMILIAIAIDVLTENYVKRQQVRVHN